MEINKPDSFEKSVIMLRGLIINHTIEIERKMDNALANHFCGNLERKNELCELLLFTERITFDMKKQILYSILQTHYKGFIEENPEFMPSLEDIV
ncbi:MAG: hypothetical protein EOP42_30850, partial [Sphingobacteriaceae bacterium]